MKFLCLSALLVKYSLLGNALLVCPYWLVIILSCWLWSVSHWSSAAKCCSFPRQKSLQLPWPQGNVVPLWSLAPGPAKVPMSAINQGKPWLGRDSFFVSAQILPASLVWVAQVRKRPIFSWGELVQWHSWRKQKENKAKPHGFSSFPECGSRPDATLSTWTSLYHFSLVKTRHYSDKFSRMQAVFPKITLHFTSICFCISITISFNTYFKTLYMMEVRLMICTFKMVSFSAQDLTLNSLKLFQLLKCLLNLLYFYFVNTAVFREDSIQGVTLNCLYTQVLWLFNIKLHFQRNWTPCRLSLTLFSALNLYRLWNSLCSALQSYQ